MRPPEPAKVDKGYLVPGTRKLSQAGRTAILDMARRNPRLAPNKIGKALGLDAQHVKRAIAEDAMSPPPDGLRTASGTLTPFARDEIIRRYDQGPPRSLRALARSLGVSAASVSNVLKNRNQEAASASAAVQAPLRPLVQVADWHEVAQRGWNAGDRFTLPMEGGPALFEVTRHRQQGDAFDPRDFRPVIRGG